MQRLTSILNIGIVGFGSRAQAIFRQIEPLKLGLRSVIIAEPDPLRARLAKQLAPQASIVSDWRDIPSREIMPLSAVLVINGDDDHAETICGLAEIGHDVLTEKPMGTSLGQYRMIEKCLEGTGTRFAVFFEMPQAPLFKAVDGLIAEGHIGRIVRIDMVESIGYKHWQDSFSRRGRWPNSMLALAKCSHDMHRLGSMAGQIQCISATGGRNHFVPINKPAIATNATNCFECAGKLVCPASALRYVSLFEEGDATKRPIPAITAEALLNPNLSTVEFTQILQNSTYSSCVFNDEEGTFDGIDVRMEHVAGVQSHFRATVHRGEEVTRRFRIYGTNGVIAGDLARDMLFLNGRQVELEVLRGGYFRHDGSDAEFLKLFKRALESRDWSSLPGFEESFGAHMAALTVHRSIANGGAVCAC